MIGPVKKISKRKGAIRHSAWRTKVIKKLVKKTQICSCNHCGEPKLYHRVCASCGFYRGQQILTIKTKSSDNVVEA